MRIIGEFAVAILMLGIVFAFVTFIRQLGRPKKGKRNLVVDTRHLESGATEVFVASRDELGSTPDRIKWSREVDDDDIELRIALEDARSFKRQFEG